MTIGRCGLVILLCVTIPAATGPVQAQPPARNNILLPGLPAPEPLNEAVLFAFDAVSFPQRENVSLDLIQGRDPRRV